MAANINVTGVVFGTIFGALFLLTCLISAVKAVKDRKRIKERIEAKRRQRLESSAFDNPQNENYQHSNVNGNSSPSKEKKMKKSTKRHTDDVKVIVHNSTGRSNSSEVLKEERQNLKPSCSKSTSSTSNLYDMTGDSNSGHFEYKQYSPQNAIIASRNTLRRMSYDVAVGEFSFLNNQESPKYASSSSITNVYTHFDSGPVVVFDNKAYDSENQI